MSFNDDHFRVVFDAGSQNAKVGFAGDASPRSIFPSVVGRFRRQGLTDGISGIYCGYEAIQKRGVSHLTWPIQEGFITNWEEMEKLWHHIFYTNLMVPPEQCSILHTVHPLVPKGDREKTAEILFESFAIEGLNLMKTPILVLHASGRTSGVVWENGLSSSVVTPIYEGFPLQQAIVTSPMTGEFLSARLQNLVKLLGYSFTTPIEKDVLDKIKADICYVCKDYDEEMKIRNCEEIHVNYRLPDDQNIVVGKERFLCPEVLFQPSLQNHKYQNIVENISVSVETTDEDCRSLFYENVVVAGGSTLFPGLVDRLLKELTRAKKISGMKVAIDEIASRQFSAWVGGSILASLKGLTGFWMTKKEYDDVGPDRVNYKFF